MLICLIWFTRAVNFIKYITEKGIGFSEFISLFILVLPWIALIIIPISLFIAVLIVYDRMLISNELAILKSSGLDKFSIAKPAIWAALICCLICYLMSFYLMPLSNKKLRLARSNFQNNYANIMISPGIFETLNNLTIYVKNRNNHNELFGILIYDNRNPNYAIVITAEGGSIGENQSSTLLYLNNGTAQKFNYSTRKSEILKFDTYVVNLNDNKEVGIGKYIWKAKERYINELINPDDESSASDVIKYRVELHHRIVYPAISLILALIGTSFILNGKFNRRGNFISIISAIISGTIFVISTMMIYDIMEKSIKFAPLLYVNFFIFAIVGLITLKYDFQYFDRIRKK